jgi:hypothetical protein
VFEHLNMADQALHAHPGFIFYLVPDEQELPGFIGPAGVNSEAQYGSQPEEDKQACHRSDDDYQ